MNGSESGMWRHDETRVFTVERVSLQVSEGPWAFAESHAADINAHWQRRLHESPNFFNGTVHILADYTLSGRALLTGRFLRTDFKSFLYWRETGWQDRSVMDAFGSALILSAEGDVLLGRQRAGNLNAGLCYPPGGFIDPRDVGPDGVIDIEGSVLREITEETGLDARVLRRSGGYVVTLAGPSISIAVPWQSHLSGPALLDEVSRFIAADPDGELSSVVLTAPGEASAALAMPDYARALLRDLPDLKTSA
jgi:8-oxo-dGTP pyrophosphatase MutT (NUDIX family)